jgi:hypothetical protein
MLDSKEIVASASLERLSEGPQSRYSFYAGMLVGASLSQTSKILMDYQLYVQMIPYIKKAEYSPQTHLLRLEGGIWNFKLQSQIEFTEKSNRWIRYRIAAGHFSGLEGNIYFEPVGEKGTLVYFSGEQTATRWPPQFVIERGAEIVFGFTARRMRSYIESQKKVEKGVQSDPSRPEVPRPRSHL